MSGSNEASTQYPHFLCLLIIKLYQLYCLFAYPHVYNLTDFMHVLIYILFIFGKLCLNYLSLFLLIPGTLIIIALYNNKDVVATLLTYVFTSMHLMYESAGVVY